MREKSSDDQRAGLIVILVAWLAAGVTLFIVMVSIWFSFDESLWSSWCGDESGATWEEKILLGTCSGAAWQAMLAMLVALGVPVFVLQRKNKASPMRAVAGGAIAFALLMTLSTRVFLAEPNFGPLDAGVMSVIVAGLIFYLAVSTLLVNVARNDNGL